MRSRVELFEAIRRDARGEELSIRGLADRYGVHRRTVRQALAAAEPPPRKVPVRAAPRLDPAKALIDGMLREDLTAPKKQRHTARRIHARLVDEHALTEITYSTVRDYVHERRPQIWAEAGRSPEEVYISQVGARRAATGPATDQHGDQSGSRHDDEHGEDATVLTLPVTGPGEGSGDVAGQEVAGPEQVQDGLADGLINVVRRQLAGLPGERPLPSVDHYDQLLTRPGRQPGRQPAGDPSAG